MTEMGFKKIFCVLISVAACVCAFSDDWRVCMGSFRNLDKARERVSELEGAGISSFVAVAEGGGGTLYRVLFSERFSAQRDASHRRAELLSLEKIRAMRLTDLWCCRFDGRKLEETTEVESSRPVGKPVERAATAASVKEEKKETAEGEEPSVRFIPIVRDPPAQKQTLIVRVNGVEEQRFEIDSRSKVIKINVDLDRSATVKEAEDVPEDSDSSDADEDLTENSTENSAENFTEDESPEVDAK